MKFKKGFFFIQQIPNADQQFKLIKGWISEDGAFGFNKKGKFWIVSDIATGMFIFAYKTRKDCAMAVKERIDDINIAHVSQTARNAADAMKAFCSKELKKY